MDFNNNNQDSLPFVLYSVGESVKQPMVQRDDGAPWNQIIWVKKGSGAFNVGEDSFVLCEGEGVFMRHGVSHGYKMIGDCFYTEWVTFTSDDRLVDYSLKNKAFFIFRVPDFLANETENLRLYAQSETSEKLLLSAMGYSYVAELIACITKKENNVIDAVRGFLTANCSRPLTLDEISDAVGIDKYTLCRYFAKNHRCTVMEELKRIRLSKAKRLLRYSSEGIEQIGYDCGFESPSYFAMRFRERCGCSPSEYRKRYR